MPRHLVALEELRMTWLSRHRIARETRQAELRDAVVRLASEACGGETLPYRVPRYRDPAIAMADAAAAVARADLLLGIVLLNQAQGTLP
ncbi:MAG: hypothetical protein KBC46_03290 [Ferrovibrio sp.]|nr:hypothetical protein [Ferrovibrio sp.]